MNKEKSESKNILADHRTIYAAISLLNYTDFEIIGVQMDYITGASNIKTEYPKQ